MKYLFIAKMDDGSYIEQTPEDVSAYAEGRSAYYDVAQRLDEVQIFAIQNEHNVYLVDLRDGHFEVNGVPFSAQPVSAPTIKEGGKFKLLYFRDHQQELHVTAGGKSTTGAHYIQFRFGWEYTDPLGQSYIQTIVVV